jgi:hypothetical protein
MASYGSIAGVLRQGAEKHSELASPSVQWGSRETTFEEIE